MKKNNKITPKQKELSSLLKEFKEEWPLKRVKKMSIEEYTFGNKDRDNFSYWIEIKTKRLGGISGIHNGGSFKFGIFKSTNKYKNSRIYKSNGKYAWCIRYGNTPNLVYQNIKKKVITLVEAALNHDYDIIEKELDLDIKERINPEFGWKIVYLYSRHGRFCPFFDKKFLLYVVKILGGNNFDKNSTRMELQNFIYKNRDKSINLFDFADDMWFSYKGKYPKDEDSDFEMEGGSKHIYSERTFNKRNQNLIRKLKKNISECEACEEKTNKFYKFRDQTILEFHHIKPFNLPYWSKERKILRKDYAIICPNCHRAIHRYMSITDKNIISIKEFKNLVGLSN